MAKVKMLRRPNGTYNGKPFPEVGETFDTNDDHAKALVTLRYAEKVDEKPAEKPAEKRETATSEDAEKRETREADKPVKRGPGRPRKSDK